VAVGVPTHPGGPVGVEVIPDEDDGGAELQVCADRQVAVVTPGEMRFGLQRA
jgi:hypothetical protein